MADFTLEVLEVDQCPHDEAVISLRLRGLYIHTH